MEFASVIRLLGVVVLCAVAESAVNCGTCGRISPADMSPILAVRPHISVLNLRVHAKGRVPGIKGFHKLL